MTTGRKTDYTVAQVRLPREAHGLPVQAHTPSSILVMLSCRAAPCHATPAASQQPAAARCSQRRPASGQRPATSDQRTSSPAANSARHTTRSRELGPTILACPLVKIQERALQGKHKLGYHDMGLPVPLTSRSESCSTPAVPPRYAGHVPAAAPLLPTWAPGHPLESAVPLVKHQPREPSLPTIIYLISAGGTGMMNDDVNEMAGATSCTPTHPHHPVHRSSPPATSFTLVPSAPTRLCSQTPTARHTAARRRRRQRQRQRLFDLDLRGWAWGLGLGAWDLDLDTLARVALTIIALRLPSIHPCLRASLRFEPSAQLHPSTPFNQSCNSRRAPSSFSLSGLGGGVRQSLVCLTALFRRMCSSHALGCPGGSRWRLASRDCTVCALRGLGPTLFPSSGMRGQRSGLHARCNLEPPSTSYVLHSTAQVKMTGATWMGTSILAPRLGGSTAQWPPPPPSPPCTGCLTPVRPTGPQTEPTEIARFHSLRDPSLRPSATPNHNRDPAHSISVKYFSPAPSSCLLHVPVLSSRLDDFGWPCLTRRPRSSTLTPCASCYLALPPSLPSISLYPTTTDFILLLLLLLLLPPSTRKSPEISPNAVLGRRRQLNHTLFANIGTLLGVCLVEHSADQDISHGLE